MRKTVKHSMIHSVLVSISLFLSIHTLAYSAEMNKGAALENIIELNQGQDQHITARSLKDSSGNQTFQSKMTIPGVRITEQVHQHNNGPRIQENRIVVDIAKNESVEFIQQFDATGRKVSRSVVRRSASRGESLASARNNAEHKSVVVSEGGPNDVAIEHQTAINGSRKYTTTTVRSNQSSFISSTQNWMLIASGGYDHFADAINSDGSTAVARLALNRQLFQSGSFDVGLEAGIQNGVNMRPVVTEQTLDALGGTPVLATIKPVVELLSTISKHFSDNGSFSGFAKLGVAYRSMTFDRDTIPNINKISPDLHLGISSKVSDSVSLMLYYQVVFGSDSDIKATSYPLPANNLGTASSMPTQQGVLLGVAYHF